ncbi:MAG: hypothetical protein HWE26_13680 [Alteromonadaceae bacterium]|nr:hypothetical protein [Alteromonadaceae bacterium]
MLETWIEAGLDPAQFWDLTPREAQTWLRGALAAMKNRRREIYAAARLNHIIQHNPKNFPEMSEFMGEPRKRASPAEIKRKLFLAFGMAGALN